MSPEWSEALLALGETGSVTVAAERCHLSQPAFTRRLQRLAATVGAPILRRQGRRVTFTAAGEALLALARRQGVDWVQTVEAIHGRPAPLELGCGATIALTLLPRALLCLRERDRTWTVRIHAGDSAVTVSRLLAGEIDAGLVTTPSADRRLGSIPLLRDPVVAVAACTENAIPANLAELARRPLCLYGRGTGFRSFVDALFATAGWFPDPVAEVDSLEALRELAAAGLGFALLPHSVAASAIAAGRLRLVDIPELHDAARTVTLLHRADKPQHPAFAPLQGALEAAALSLAQRLAASDG